MLEMIQQLFNTLNLSQQANNGDVWGIGLILLMLLAIFFKFLAIINVKKSVTPPPFDKETANLIKKTSDSNLVKDDSDAPVDVSNKISWNERLSKGLSRSSSEVWGKVFNLFSNGISDDLVDEVEELLYGADLGPAIVSEIIDKLEEEVKKGDLNEAEFKKFLFDNLKARMIEIQNNVNPELYKPSKEKSLKVIMIVGVNGAGKTTTIGKLATKLTSQGARVVVGACDTFRAAAVDQLQVWCDRANATMIRAKEGANPSGVGYDALQQAVSLNADYCLLDTAGRLHTKENLMDELKKSKNVLKKLLPEAPHEIILVLDAITGQNALRQAEEFNKVLGLTGLVFTKCDGSSKAGSAISIVEKLKVPISYIGVGESVEDLDRFVLDEYLCALLGIKAL